jgi:hypothetical protein
LLAKAIVAPSGDHASGRNGQTFGTRIRCPVPSAFMTMMSSIDSSLVYAPPWEPHDLGGGPLRKRANTIWRPSGDQANAASSERSPLRTTDRTVPDVATVVSRGTQLTSCETRWTRRPSPDHDASIAGPSRRDGPPAAGTIQAAPAAAYNRSPLGGTGVTPGGIGDGNGDAGGIEDAVEAGVAAAVGFTVAGTAEVHPASRTVIAQTSINRFNETPPLHVSACRPLGFGHKTPGRHVCYRCPAHLELRLHSALKMGADAGRA